MKTKTYIQSYVPFFLVMISSSFVLLGFFLVFSSAWLGLLILGLGLSGFTYHDGTEIDFTTRRAREFFGIAFIRIGDWQAIHPDNELQLRDVTMAYGRSFGGVLSTTTKNKEHKLMIRTSNGKFLLIKHGEKRTELEALQIEIEKELH